MSLKFHFSSSFLYFVVEAHPHSLVKSILWFSRHFLVVFGRNFYESAETSKRRVIFDYEFYPGTCKVETAGIIGKVELNSAWPEKAQNIGGLRSSVLVM